MTWIKFKLLERLNGHKKLSGTRRAIELKGIYVYICTRCWFMLHVYIYVDMAAPMFCLACMVVEARAPLCWDSDN